MYNTGQPKKNQRRSSDSWFYRGVTKRETGETEVSSKLKFSDTLTGQIIILDQIGRQ